jgi:hypothetical protein
MKPWMLLVSVLELALFEPRRAFGLAGDLKSPSLSMPAATPVEFRTNVLAALSDKNCKFLDGHFINASTTLNYGGSTAALNQLINQLSSFEGLRVMVGFVSNAGGPSWIIQHNGWGDGGQIYIKINVAAPDFKPEQLQLSVAASKHEER